MTSYILYPSEKLSAIVLRYECFQVKNIQPLPGKLLVLPSLVNDFVFSFFEGEIPLISNHALNRAKLPEATMLSSFSGRTEVDRICKMEAIRVVLVPGVVSLLYQLDLGQLEKRPIDLGRDVDPELSDLHAKMAMQSCVESRIALLEEQLTKRLSIFNKDEHLFPILDDVLKDKDTNHSVSELARSCYCSDRQFYRKIKKQFGISPQDFLTLYRNNAVLRYINKHPRTALGKVAYEFGFNDQPHFIRAFKRYAGMTPGRLARQLHSTPILMP